MIRTATQVVGLAIALSILFQNLVVLRQLVKEVKYNR